MDQHHDKFDWVPFPDGKIRFVGGVRGVDELGHDAIAAEIGNRVYFGEIGNAFLPNRNDFNIEVISFGWPGEEWLGMTTKDACAAFTAAEVETLRFMITELVRRASEWNSKPVIMYEDAKARFMGQVIFRDGWIALKE